MGTHHDQNKSSVASGRIRNTCTYVDDFSCGELVVVVTWSRASNLRQSSGRAKWNCCVARDWRCRTYGVQKITPGPRTSGIDEQSSQIGRRLHKWSMCLKQIKVRSGARIEKTRNVTRHHCMIQCPCELGHETADNPQRTFVQPPVRESDERIASTILILHLAKGRFRALLKRPLRQVLPAFQAAFS